MVCNLYLYSDCGRPTTIIYTITNIIVLYSTLIFCMAHLLLDLLYLHEYKFLLLSFLHSFLHILLPNFMNRKATKKVPHSIVLAISTFRVFIFIITISLIFFLITQINQYSIILKKTLKCFAVLCYVFPLICSSNLDNGYFVLKSFT